MDYISKHERRLLKHKLKEEEKIAKQDRILKENKSRLIKKSSIIFIIGLVIIIGIVSAVRYYNTVPGAYDDFAKCLTEKGAIMYGAIEWCKYTKEQAAMFGKSFKYINYKNYKEREGIKITPTWIINNEILERVQSFDRLASSTGCNYK